MEHQITVTNALGWQSYDKNGNRLSFHKNTVNAAAYGRDVNLAYTYDALNRPVAMTDSDQAQYAAAFTCDANGNITQITESVDAGRGNVSYLYNYYDVDALNRVTSTRLKTLNTLGRSCAHNSGSHA